MKIKEGFWDCFKILNKDLLNVLLNNEHRIRLQNRLEEVVADNSLKYGMSDDEILLRAGTYGMGCISEVVAETFAIYELYKHFGLNGIGAYAGLKALTNWYSFYKNNQIKSNQFQNKIKSVR